MQLPQNLIFVLDFRKLARDFYSQVDDIFQSWPVLALQAIEHCQPVLNLG